jgi:hypothetical protein
MHHPISFYFFMVALFCLWAWGAMDSIHTLRQRATKPFWKLFWATLTLIGSAILMLIMIVVAVVGAIEGIL